MAMLHRIIREGQAQVKVYTDTLYDYVCEGPPEAAASDALWRVRRVALDGSAVQWPGGHDDYRNVATDLAAVQALFA